MRPRDRVSRCVFERRREPGAHFARRAVARDTILANTRGGVTMPATIETLVVLMMENRSFDHMLGFTKSDAYKIDGLDGGEINHDSTGEPVRVDNSAAYTDDLATDPSHDFEAVMEQMFGVRSPWPR